MTEEKFAQVRLISKPENMLKTIYTACRTCYSADSPLNIYDCENAQDEEKMLKLISRVVSSGHYSTIEHIQVSFAISNISRACSHQLVRHRHMSFSQKSQRYVKEKGQFDYLTPNTIEKDEEYECIIGQVTVCRDSSLRAPRSTLRSRMTRWGRAFSVMTSRQTQI